METRKAARSSTALPSPKGIKPESTLYPSTQGSDSTRMAKKFTNTAFLRLQPHKSIPKATMFSNTAITVDSAAKLMNTKNSAPHTRPPAMPPKILGSVTNTRPGPCPGLTPKEKQAGKMIRPAISATKVSSSVMLTLSLSSVRSLPM